MAVPPFWGGVIVLPVSGSRRESFTLKRRSGPEMTGARERAEPSSENPGSRNKIQVRYIYFSDFVFRELLFNCVRVHFSGAE